MTSMKYSRLSNEEIVKKQQELKSEISSLEWEISRRNEVKKVANSKKEDKRLPLKIRKQFAKQIKELFIGENHVLELGLPKEIKFKAKVNVSWREDKCSSYEFVDDLDNVIYTNKQLANLYNQFESDALILSEQYTKKIEKFNEEFDKTCKNYNVYHGGSNSYYEEFDDIIDEFKLGEYQFR